MTETRYFCDRCKAEVTTVGAQFALFEIVINRPGANAFKMAVCRKCGGEIQSFTEQNASLSAPSTPATWNERDHQMMALAMLEWVRLVRAGGDSRTLNIIADDIAVNANALMQWDLPSTPRVENQGDHFRSLAKMINGALKSCIDAHGPITKEAIGSASKRIISALLPSTPASPPQAWQPIETADRNGYPIILAVGGKTELGFWSQQRMGFLSFAARSPTPIRPTHWMPLPPAPDPAGSLASSPQEQPK